MKPSLSTSPSRSHGSLQELSESCKPFRAFFTPEQSLDCFTCLMNRLLHDLFSPRRVDSHASLEDSLILNVGGSGEEAEKGNRAFPGFERCRVSLAEIESYRLENRFSQRVRRIRIHYAELL